MASAAGGASAAPPTLDLVLGDGDLSYAAGLARAASARPLVATTFEAAADVRARYGEAAANIAALSALGHTVLHAVDATDLATTLVPRLPAGARFATVHFNFPHTEGKNKIKQLRQLLARALSAAAPLLAPGGAVRVALCRGQGGTIADGEALRSWHDHWQAPLLGARAGLVLRGAVPFEPPAGYAPRREPGNKSARAEKAFDVAGAIVHVFASPVPAADRAVAAARARAAVALSDAVEQETRKGMFGRPSTIGALLCVPCAADPRAAAEAALARMFADAGAGPADLRWVGDDDGPRRLELRRPNASTLAVGGLVALTASAWVEAARLELVATVNLDLLACLAQGCADPRQLGVPDGARSVHSYSFVYDLRLRDPERALASDRVAEAVREAVGADVLVSVREPDPNDRDPVRVWRLVLNDAIGAMDDAGAYERWQRARFAARDLGGELA